MIVRDKAELDVFQEIQTIDYFYNNAVTLKDKINANPQERMLAHTKEGIVKELLDEIIPLAFFAKKHCKQNEKIKWCYGNQQYDAKIYNDEEELLYKIEITFPHCGHQVHKKNENLVNQLKQSGVGMVDFSEEFDIFRLTQKFEEAAKKKSEKQYDNCILVFNLQYPTLDVSDPKETLDVETIKTIISKYSYHASKVYLYESRIGSKIGDTISQIK